MDHKNCSKMHRSEHSSEDNGVKSEEKSASRMICFVPSCKQRYKRGISFHSFPPQSDNRIWTQRLRLNIEPLKTSRICSLHFSIGNFITPASDRMTDRLILKRSAVPDTNLPEAPVSSTKKKLKEGRAMRAANRSENKLVLEKANMIPDVDTDGGNNEQPMEIYHPPLIDCAVQVNTIELDNLKRKRTSAVIFGNDDDLLAWTGLKSSAMLKAIVKSVTLLEQYRSRPHSSVTLEEEVLIVFIKLKTNISFRCISVLFRLHKHTVSNCFQRILPFLTAALKCAIYWPTEEQPCRNIEMTILEKSTSSLF
ncbi:uncharacterized protein LOC134210774 isoform X2 [Armigeres subalbatus]|uniref:uncharacterized protein LOC134210774 isoform X2 n=1 Tax=Armigeres subalbatus TaxID=124917 RepID=UPI002ED297FF